MRLRTIQLAGAALPVNGFSRRSNTTEGSFSAPGASEANLPVVNGFSRRSNPTEGSFSAPGALGATLEVLFPEAEREGEIEALDDPALVLAGPLPDGPESLAEPTVVHDMAWDGSTFLIRQAFPPGTSFYGTGERAGPLERTGRLTIAWNTDAFMYSDASPALYQSQPAVLAVAPDGAAVFMVALSARKISIAIGEDGVEFAVSGAPCALARISASGPSEAVSALTELIGRPARMPDWALGYHQCRWSYMSAEEIRALIEGFETRELPLSTVWLDIDYMDRFRVFTWDAERFGDVPALVRELHEKGLRAIAIIDPGLPVDADYEVGQSALQGEHLVVDGRGRPVEGRVWPGRCWFPDFTRDETRAFWAERVKAFVQTTGLDGLWCDMNEPAVFSSPTLTLPEDAVHRGLGGGTHAQFHNLYGQLMAEATREGLEAARPDVTPFVLTRAAHLATPRTAATWTGDNLASWDDLRWSVSMILGLGLVGQPSAGPDVGGFIGDPGGELFARWFEVGCYFPFFRGHSAKGSPRKEPWSFGPAVEARVQASLKWRVRLLPHLRSCFEEAAQTGLPVMRPAFLADPADIRLRQMDDAFLLGPDLFVAPALAPGAVERTLPLPPGRWHRVPIETLLGTEPSVLQLTDTGEAYELHLRIETGPAPCFLRAGAELNLGPIVNRPADRPIEVTTRVIA